MKRDHLDIANEYSSLLRADEADDRQPGSFRFSGGESAASDEGVAPDIGAAHDGTTVMPPVAGNEGVVIPRVVPSHEDEQAGGVEPGELSLWGAGPRIVVPALLAELCGAGLTLALPGAFGMGILPHWVWAFAGLCALLLGTLTVRHAWATLKPGRVDGRLVTGGPYRITRNPIYAGWILGILPGIALCFASWPMLAGPVVAWALFRETVIVEESFLAARFGEEWEAYATRVNRLWPNPFRMNG
jgi:protein-S-isoprenylcysteine O-methyltransferase Ste14